MGPERQAARAERQPGERGRDSSRRASWGGASAETREGERREEASGTAERGGPLAATVAGGADLPTPAHPARPT